MSWSEARFSTVALIAFLRGVDAQLHSKCRILVVGSAAPIFWTQQVLVMSGDVDVLWAEGAEFAEACARARAETQLPIPVNQVGVYDLPHDYEDRLMSVGLGAPFAHLEVLVPERHDWALMKMVRGEQHDLDLVELVHRIIPFEESVLVHRCQSMAKTVVAVPASRFKLHVVLLLERLWGAQRASELEPTL
jgi:hypothetical protein